MGLATARVNIVLKL